MQYKFNNKVLSDYSKAFDKILDIVHRKLTTLDKMS